LTPEQLATCGQTLYGEQWQSALARRIGVDARTVRKWLAGDRAIPQPAAELLALLVRYPRER
jgi:DNA-binding transcriptional regulator YiaG